MFRTGVLCTVCDARVYLLIHFRMESGKATLTRDVTIDKQDYGNIVDITHFDTG